MTLSLQVSLSKLVGSPIVVSVDNGYLEPGQASAMFQFGGGTWLQAAYWRLSENCSASYSSFDHQQQYGLPAIIDAIQELQRRH